MHMHVAFHGIQACGANLKGLHFVQAYRPFNGHPKVLLVSLGRMHGVMHVGGVVIKHLLPRAKAKNLFIPQTRKSIGLDRPKQGISCARAPAVAQ